MAGLNRLETRDLHAGYRGGDILRDVSVAVEPGEVLVLLGPNGAGKTTLLRALARLLRPRGGVVLLDEADLWRRPPSWTAQRVALAMQQDAAGWPLTVAETVSLGRAAHRGWVRPFREHDRDVVRRALERTELVSLRDRPITELSSGEWQRVLLARALAQESAVLLFDEPTAHLDLRFQVEVLRLARRLAHADGLAVVLTLHDLNQAALWADRIALLVGGRLLEVGPPVQVLTAERVSEAYSLRVDVFRHPQTGTPFITPVIER
jgi:iron complex transport system ATP-binding protein